MSFEVDNVFIRLKITGRTGPEARVSPGCSLSIRSPPSHSSSSILQQTDSSVWDPAARYRSPPSAARQETVKPTLRNMSCHHQEVFKPKDLWLNRNRTPLSHRGLVHYTVFYFAECHREPVRSHSLSNNKLFLKGLYLWLRAINS